MQTILKKIDHRGVLTLNMHRPQVHNAFDAVMIGELIDVLAEAEEDTSIRLVVITGSGSCFSAGADLKWMSSLVDASREDNQRDALQLAKLMRKLNYLSKPSIAMINGSAFGGGVGLIACCDITIAVDNARYGLTEARLGLAPAVISPYVFRSIGETQARRYFLSGERFDSQRAVDIGLVQQSVKAELLEDCVEDMVHQMLSGGPLALAHCKQLVFKMAGHDEASQKLTDEFTSKLIANLRVSTEGQEGLTAFLEKRKPAWVNEKSSE